MAYRGQGGGGRRFSRGGSKRRKNSISIDFNGFAEYAERLDELGADLQKVFTNAMEQAGETITDDTIEAAARPNMPRQGKYSGGDTESSIIRNPRVEWQGGWGEMGFGFDKTKPGSGGFLITGTPRMAPDHALEVIYRNKTYERSIMNDLNEYFGDALDQYLGG